MAISKAKRRLITRLTGGGDIPVSAYQSVWRDGFASLSLRNGGPTPAGFATGKGTWADAGLYYNPGTGNNAKGYYDFGYGWFVDHTYNWQAIDPTYPPLGQLDITAAGLSLIAGSNFPLVRNSLPGVNITPPPASSSGWYNSQSGTFTTGVSVDGLPAPAVIAAGGANQSSRREYFKGSAFKAGETISVVVKYAFGTSNSIRVLTAFSNGQFTSGYIFGNTFTQDPTSTAGNWNNVAINTFANHKELSFTMTVPVDSYINVGVGPNSTTNGQTVIVYDFQTFRSPYLSGLVTNMYSGLIKPPFYRETVFTMPGGPNDFSAVWGLGLDTSQGQFEFDDCEWFGTTYPLDEVFGTLHTPQGSVNSNLLTGTSLVGRQITIGVQYTKDFIAHYYGGRNGTLISKIAIPAGAEIDQQHYSLLDECVGFAVTGMPAALAAASSLVVRSIEYFAPASNTSYSFPPSPPVPALTWNAGFTGGVIPVATASGTVVGTLAGSATYSVLGTTKLAISGSNLVTVGTQTAATIPFYIQGLDAGGNPGIAPKLTATVS